MKPSQVSRALLRIADKIDNSKNPDRGRVATSLNNILSSMNRQSNDMSNVISSHDSYVSVVDSFIEGLKNWNLLALKEFGYEDINDLVKQIESGDPEAIEFGEFWDILNEQVSLVEKSLSSVRGTLGQLDQKAQEINL